MCGNVQEQFTEPEKRTCSSMHISCFLTITNVMTKPNVFTGMDYHSSHFVKDIFDKKAFLGTDVHRAFTARTIEGKVTFTFTIQLLR